jgi:hypothetical protein
MSRFEWLIVIALLAIASVVTLSHLEGTQLGRWLSGEPLPAIEGSDDSRLFYAIPLLALLIWWASRWFPDKRDFLRTGAYLLIGAGILYALYLLVA